MPVGSPKVPVKFDKVQKYFGPVKVLEQFDLDVAPGEFLVLLGASGSGKTTALRILSGLETATAGRVVIGERDVTNILPKYRDVSMVFQSYALYPHKTVAELKHMQQALGITTIYVTHDQIEAMTLAHRVAILDKGVLEQLATPAEIYKDPANLFVAQFIGSPPMNIVRGSLEGRHFLTNG